MRILSAAVQLLPVPKDSLPGAIREWRRAIGEAHVVTEARALRAVETATFETHQRVPVILRPGSTEELRDCLKIASRFRTPVYPVSRGKNWGLGSSVPVESGGVVIQLARLSAITRFDGELGTLRVQAGVTFHQAYEFLRGRRSRFFLSTTGSSPHSSLIGNMLERGEGAGPYGDRCSHVSALEAVLCTGETVRGGFSRYGADESGTHRYGVGPWLDGLFSQSNLAVVTEATFHLALLPKSFTLVHFRVERARLARALDAIRELRMERTLQGSVGLWNDFRVASAEGCAAVTQDEALKWAKSQAGGGGFFGALPVYAATEAQGKAATERVRELLGPHTAYLRLESRAGDPTVGDELPVPGGPAAKFFQGVPHEESLRSLYVHQGASPKEDLDPGRDGCGALWLCLFVPFRGQEVADCVSQVESACTFSGVPPLVVVNTATERTAHVTVLITFDPEAVGAELRARACHDALLARARESGWLPYRLGIASMDGPPPAVDDSPAVFSRLRQAFDPARVLAPGRYPVR